MAIDQDGLGEAALLDNGLATMDDFMETIVRDEVFQNLDGR